MAKKISSEDLMAGILSYLNILVLIPLFLIKKKTDFAKFHIQQGVNLFILWLIAEIVWMVPVLGLLLSPILYLVYVALGILSLIAIIKALQGQMWKIPYISDLKLFDIKTVK